jgi:hypothetical protein
MKTKEITLPIDPNKTYVAEFRYGLCAVPITVIGYEHVAGGFEKGWALIAEVVEDEQSKCDQDIDNQQTIYWKKMKEFMKQNQKTNPVIRKEQPKEFIIGGMYDVCDNNGYTSFGKLIDFSTTNGQYVIEHFDGTFCIYLRPGIIGRHSLAEHIYTTQEIEAELNTWQDEPISPVAFCKRGKIIRQLLK